MPTEDEIYRSSTQYRLWNFTPDRLAAYRRKTNKLAVNHVKKARHRIRERTSQSIDSPIDEDDSQFLTVDEEQLLVSWYCTQLIAMTHSLPNPDTFPANVLATAIQYIKRFYLTNSPMSYAPKAIMTTSLFLACKTESHHLSVRRFVATLTAVKGLEGLTQEEVLAPEYIISQGLRFTFDVRHAFRALKGVFIELQLLLNYARGDTLPPSWRSDDRPSRSKGGAASSASASGGAAAGGGSGPQINVQQYLTSTYGSPVAYSRRIEESYAQARATLHSAALVSDAYFLYTPSQITFGALYLADADVVRGLLELRVRLPLPGAAGSTPDHVLMRRAGLDAAMREIEACAALLREALALAASDEMGAEARRVGRKLEGCRNPEKLDLVGLNKSQKRDGEEDGKLDENKAKRIKLAREESQKEDEDIFGGKLQ